MYVNFQSDQLMPDRVVTTSKNFDKDTEAVFPTFFFFGAPPPLNRSPIIDFDYVRQLISRPDCEMHSIQNVLSIPTCVTWASVVDVLLRVG